MNKEKKGKKKRIRKQAEETYNIDIYYECKNTKGGY